MRGKPLLIALLALTAGCAATSAEPRNEDPLGKDNDTTRELARRTAGEPQDCVPIEPGRSLSAVERGTILYGGGRTLWLVRLRDHCPSIRRLDTLIVEPTGSQYCRGDRIRSVSPGSTIPGPICVIESFVPYTRSE